nr:diguanylate cyclase [Aurantimonas marina]
MPGVVDAIAASIAVIDLDGGKPDRVLACNCHFRRMLGIRAPDGAGARLRDLLPGYARRNIAVQIEECVRTVTPVEIVQVIDLEGRTFWWRMAAQPILNGAREPGGVLLTCLDITEKIQLENELKTANSRFSAVIQSAYDGIVTVDRQRHIHLFNAAAEEMFGYSAEEIRGRPLNTLIPEKYHDRHAEHLETFSNSPISSRQMFERDGQIFGLAKDGTQFPVEVSIAKITVGGATEFTALIRDISERAKLIEELKRQALIDQLTGLPNRRAFNEQAADQMALARRHDRPLSVLMIDLDRFKRINDTRGHPAGDMVLRAMASAGTCILRQSDIFARLGGEEFAVVLPEADEGRAIVIAERLRQAVANARFQHDWGEHGPIPFTISIGVAPCFNDDLAIEYALKRADRALYDAKQDGRNRVKIWSRMPEAAGELRAAG